MSIIYFMLLFIFRLNHIFANDATASPTKETKERLSKIFDEMDSDKDGYIDSVELKNFLKLAQQNYLREKLSHYWKKLMTQAGSANHDQNSIDFATYLASDLHKSQKTSKQQNEERQKAVKERRWKYADRDNNGRLTREEFFHFIYPTESAHMKPVVIEEALDLVDKNKDKKISLDEYISGAMSGIKPGDAQYAARLKDEKDHFRSKLDENKDLHLTGDEIINWVHPQDSSNEEMRQIFEYTDVDKDGMLTKEEILDKHYMFSGSRGESGEGEELGEEEEDENEMKDSDRVEQSHTEL